MPRKPSTPLIVTTPSPSSPQTFFDGHPVPALIVFDLDYTLWPFWVDTHVCAPLKGKDGGQRVVDRLGESFAFYPHVPQIFRDARMKNVSLAAASRTEAPELARDMLKSLVVDGKLRGVDYFDYMQIYPGSKTTHLAKLQKQSGVDFADMLFFDDEARNRNVESELGVLMYLVRDGITNDEVDRAVREWRSKRGKSGSYVV
ncbi:hypothetical protein FGG08_001522 [Glutinoglossum americanum]|uniref:Magnesium-dependent phosphatase n=1 Tax=Glutinoglossum americanum TaxID=1670608 RepID=A0A9P8I208_9PEZI|nr:hypothetical protein FGG08_001522 [Glutinoglossum americanum]